jgi:Ni,Fe-hydrogenase I large subunit
MQGIRSAPHHVAVVPAKAGTYRATHPSLWNMGPRFRGGDKLIKRAT